MLSQSSGRCILNDSEPQNVFVGALNASHWSSHASCGTVDMETSKGRARERERERVGKTEKVSAHAHHLIQGYPEQPLPVSL